MKLILVALVLLFVQGCSSQIYPNQKVEGKVFPSVTGETLEQVSMSLPEDVLGEPVVFLLGYKQDAQFDIDRWLIGLDMTETDVSAFELPTIQGLAPRMFQTTINNGMRKGIPKALWKGVVTIYKDGAQLQQFTGNENPNNARVMLLDASGAIQFFYDEGFSVAALNRLRKSLAALEVLPDRELPNRR